MEQTRTFFYMDRPPAHSSKPSPSQHHQCLVNIPSNPSASWSLVLIPWLLLLLLSIHLVRKDYQAFLDLGPGGTPYNFRGYLRICLFRLFVLRQPLKPPPSTPAFSTGYLTTLPQRVGSPPKITGIAPQRQMNQETTPDIYSLLTSRIHFLANTYPDSYHLTRSAFEPHSTALFSSLPPLGPVSTKSTEICHAHATDGSLHMTLHPADVKVVLEAGWGIRHPLARGDWWWKWRPVPEGFVMVFGPRSAEDVEVVMEIARASAWRCDRRHGEKS